MRIHLELMNGDATDVITIYELILMPIDEMAMDTREVADLTTAAPAWADYTTLADLDNVSKPKRNKRAVRRLVATDLINGKYSVIGPDEIIVQANADQKVWFLSEGWYTLAINRLPNQEMAHSLQLWKVQRYLSMRGDS